MVIGFTGTAGQVRDAFHTEIHYLEVKGEQRWANVRDQMIPAALAPAVVGVVSMHNFYPHPALARRAGPDYTYSGCTTSTLPTDPGTCYELVPGDIQTIYNITPLLRQGLTGSGQVIAVVEDSDTYNSQADVTTYRNTFLSRYSGGSVTTVHPGTGCTDPGATNGASGDESEADLDAEVAGIAAPSATILVAACANTTATSGVLIAIQNYSSYSTKPTIFSMSYGECETINGVTANAAFSSAYSSANASNVAVFVSTGDDGTTSCSPAAYYNSGEFYFTAGNGVSGFATTPYNVAVGGTDFEDTYQTKELTKSGGSTVAISTYWKSTNTSLDGSAMSYIPEIPWNGTCASWLIANYLNSSVPAFCNTSTNSGNTTYLNGQAAGGGPSSCATGVALGTTNNNTSAVYTVSGSCQGVPKPAFQCPAYSSCTATSATPIYGMPADGVRDIPDVALFASNGWWGHDVIICYGDTSNNSGGASCSGAPSTWSGFGGTSIATPVMAGIQAIINAKYGNQGNPVSTYYKIANTEFGSSGNSACYSINQLSESRRGIAPNCAFYDITQGDNAVDCYGAGSTECYYTSTNGVVSTQAISSVSALAPGSGYTSNPTCTLGAPPNLSSYLSPTGTSIYAGGTQATCTATYTSSGTATASTGNANALGAPGYPQAGQNITIGNATYTWVTTASAADTVVLNTSNYIVYSENLNAAVNANSSACGSSSCFGSGTVANGQVTASYSAGVVTFTAKTTGCSKIPFGQNIQGETSTAGLGLILSTNTGYLTPGTGARVRYAAPTR
jgi:subtilase family serine protease